MTDGVFRFESFDLDVVRGRLSCKDRPIHVEPRALALLCHLVKNRDRVVTKAELLDTVWRGRFVTEAALTTALRTARRAVGDDGVSDLAHQVRCPTLIIHSRVAASTSTGMPSRIAASALPAATTAGTAPASSASSYQNRARSGVAKRNWSAACW
ncbi:winged helix-turn-helix domain-containing protein [Micromonospora phaseoli]|uniref:winged helix-turn-helix domain-containing protein n=1 Tax=Micromonospora phaseoli TaxID=1144548 RepID=UPI000B843144